MDKLLEKHHLLKMTKKIENLNSPVSIKEIESIF